MKECIQKLLLTRFDSKETSITSLGEIPDGVEPPQLASKTSTSLALEWKPPLYSSGNITGYILRQLFHDTSNDESIIYFGLLTSFTVIGLKPLTNYTFSVEVCNTIGCTRSRQVSYVTQEIAPLSVNTPTILNITDRAAFIRFSKPTNEQILNAHLVGYVIYAMPKLLPVSPSLTVRVNLIIKINVSTCEECGVIVRKLDDLIPGTEYGLVLSACTNGGCTNSSELKFQTLDALPDVLDVAIRVLNRSSTYLQLAWNSPAFPNGKLTTFVLFMDQTQIYQGLALNFTITNLTPFTTYLFYLTVLKKCFFLS